MAVSNLTKRCCFLIFSGMLYSGTVTGFPDGSPLSACTLMMPGTIMGDSGIEGHDALPQNQVATYGRSKSPPYALLTTAINDTYHPGEKIDVYIASNQSQQATYYKGILMQARQVICYSPDDHFIKVQEQPLGEFTITQSVSQNTLKTLACDNREGSAVTHANRQFKINETASWTPPSSNSGPIVMQATVVQDQTVYWTNLYSHILLDESSSPAPVCKAATYCSNIFLLLIVLMVQCLLGC